MTRLPHAGLCGSCSFMQRVSGRLGQAYVLCRNEEIPVRYPALPVRACVGYRNVEVDEAT